MENLDIRNLLDNQKINKKRNFLVITHDNIYIGCTYNAPCIVWNKDIIAKNEYFTIDNDKALILEGESLIRLKKMFAIMKSDFSINLIDNYLKICIETGEFLLRGRLIEADCIMAYEKETVTTEKIDNALLVLQKKLRKHYFTNSKSTLLISKKSIYILQDNTFRNNIRIADNNFIKTVPNYSTCLNNKDSRIFMDMILHAKTLKITTPDIEDACVNLEITTNLESKNLPTHLIANKYCFVEDIEKEIIEEIIEEVQPIIEDIKMENIEVIEEKKLNVAETIYLALGGDEFKEFSNTLNFMGTGDNLCFHLPENILNAKYCQITHWAKFDNYSMDFYRIGEGFEVVHILAEETVYLEDLEDKFSELTLLPTRNIELSKNISKKNVKNTNKYKKTLKK